MTESDHPGRHHKATGSSFVRDVIFAGLPPRGRDWALMAAAGLLATAIQGYNYGFNDQAVELPFVKYFVNPALYPGDILFDSVATKQPFLWRLLAAPAEVVPLSALIAILHVVASVLTIIGVWALAVNLTRSRKSAGVGFLLVTLSVPMAYWLGLDPVRVVWAELVQRSVVFPWLLFALVLALHLRLLPAMVLIGLSVNIHPMSAGVVGMMIFAGALLDPQARRSLPCATIAAAVCASPMLIGIAMQPGEAGASTAQNQQWFDLLRLRMGHHIFPGSWELSRWLGTLFVLAIGLRAHLAVGIARRRHRTAMAWFVVPLLLWIPGFIFTELRPVPLLALAQLFRGTKFAVLIGLLYFGHHQVLRMSTGRWGQIATAWAALAVTPVLWVAGLPAAAIVALPHLLRPDRGAASADDGVDWPQRVAVAGLLVVLAGGGAMAVHQRAEAQWTNWWGGVSAEWHDVQRWVREHTPIDTMVLVPPTSKGFRFFSERPVVGTLKDGGPHENDADNMIEWWRRMQDLGCEAAGPDQIRCTNFRSFSAEELVSLGERYDADLLVTWTDHPLPWPPLYQNDPWAVYDLPIPSRAGRGAATGIGE